jgi:hypothetical protein
MKEAKIKGGGKLTHKIHFAIDIDQTICGSNAHAIYARFHADDLHLDIPPSTLNELPSYLAFLKLPQVAAFRLDNEREWLASRQRAIADPDVLRSFLPIASAQTALTSLMHSGSLCYYTARIPETRTVTQEWLQLHGFPASEQVVCCASVEQKLFTLAQYHPQEEDIILIDDRGHTHIHHTLLQQRDHPLIQALLTRLTIVSFAADHTALPADPLCPMFALPSWKALVLK